MKKLLTSLFLLIAFVGFSQTTTTSTTTTSTSSTSSTRKNTLINSWNLYQTETFNAVHAPTTTEKGDLLLLSVDGNYRLIYEGVVETGKYEINASCTQITLSASNGGMKTFKVLENTATTLKIDYKDATDIHNILYYKLGTATAASAGK